MIRKWQKKYRKTGNEKGYERNKVEVLADGIHRSQLKYAKLDSQYVKVCDDLFCFVLRNLLL